MAKVSLSLWHSGSLIRKHAKATGGRLHGFEIDKAENNRCQCPWSPQALPEKLIGRRCGANGKLRIYSRLPACPTKSGPVLSSPVFLYCSVHDHDTMRPRRRSNLLPRYQLSIHSINENYAPNYPMLRDPLQPCFSNIDRSIEQRWNDSSIPLFIRHFLPF